MTPEQQACEEHFLTQTTQQPNGRYIVRLPTKGETNQLGNSRLSVERRLHAIQRRQKQDSEHKVHYNFMKKHEELAHREPVNSHGGRNLTVYIIQFLRRQAPLPELRLYSLQAPSSPMALNNYTTNESYIRKTLPQY
jgi:hypothetical protein